MSHFGVPHTVNHAASGALRRNGKAAMSRIDRSKSRSAGGKGFYIALALCLAAVGAIGYFTLIRSANVTIDDPTPPACGKCAGKNEKLHPAHPANRAQ